jgi:hypothetical protein
MRNAAGFIAAVRAGALAAVQAALDANPDLARCRDASGVSVVCVDTFEASTVGDARRVREPRSATRASSAGAKSPRSCSRRAPISKRRRATHADAAAA